MKSRLVVGLMSGTSIDGVDAGLCRISEDHKSFDVKLEEYLQQDYPESLRKEILACCNIEESSVDKICKMNQKLADVFVDVFFALVKKAGCKVEDIDLIGSHGQTIFHIEDNESVHTFQIGAGEIISTKTGITTVSNFRLHDIALGGHGAPLVSYADYHIFHDEHINQVFQNIGGIANYTYIPSYANIDQIIGTDTGPGNMLIDGVIAILSGGQLYYDNNGSWAREGKVSNELLDFMMSHPFIAKEPPKTTDRSDFNDILTKNIIEKGKELNLGNKDIVSTVTAFTAYSIVDSYREFIKSDIDQIVISGGGRFNSTLVDMIRNYCDQIIESKPEIVPFDALGYPAEAKESVAFAFLAYQTMKGRTNNVPQITKAKGKTIMGSISPGKKFFDHVDW